MRTGLLITVILFGLLSCNPDKITIEYDKNGVVTRLPPIWKSRFSDEIVGNQQYHGYIIDGTGLLCIAARKSASGKGGEFYLQLKDINTGENIWVWDDFFDKKLARTLNRSIVFHEHRLILHDLWADYCIDTRTGTTVWKSIRGFGSASELTNVGDTYFISGLSPQSKALKKVDDSMFFGNFNDSKVEELLKPPYSSEYTHFNGETTYIGSIYRFTTFKREGEDLLLLPYDEIGPDARYNNARSFFGLYNLTKRNWVYDRKPLSLDEDGASPSLMPIVHADKAYLTSLNSVGCFDVTTGARLWQYRMTDENTGFQDILLVDDKLILSGHNGYLYCVNANNGSKIWSLPLAAFSSDIHYQDGVLYGIRGDALRACELATGKILWDLQSLDHKLEGRSDSEFSGFVTGISNKTGGKGRIFVTTNLNVYCFEAFK